MLGKQGYEHEPLTPLDAWRCVFHARQHLYSGNQEGHTKSAFPFDFLDSIAQHVLWDAQDMICGLTLENKLSPEVIDGRIRAAKKPPASVKTATSAAL